VSDEEIVLRALRERRSIRKFTDAPVDTALIRRIVEAATWAPSAGNHQDWEFGVVASSDLKHRMVKAVRKHWDKVATNQDSGSSEILQSYSEHFSWFDAAPVVIVVSARRPKAVIEHLMGADAVPIAGKTVSAAMAAQNLMLAAHACGLGSCCLTGPVGAAKSLSEIIGLSAKQQLVCLIALGYAENVPSMPQRKSVDTIMRIIE
jgi:nitroreductase